MSRNNTPLWFRKAGGGIRITRLAAWVAGFALAALVVSPPALFGAVIDDFDAAEPGWTGWNPPAAPSEPAALAELVSKRLRISANFTTAISPENPVAHLGNVYYSTDLPVRQGQTLQLSADLASLSRENLFGCLITVDSKGREYVLLRDRNEVALLKGSESDGFSVAFWETQSSPLQNVVLVLALTPEGDDLLIETGVFKSTGETVFHRTVRDTPASDWGVPDPLPHGWRVFKPDVGPPYKDDLKVVGLGMLHDTDGQQGSATVLFDNLEYRTGAVPGLEVAKSVTLSWPENTIEEPVVVSAEAIDGAYRPRPERILRQSGQLCTAVPTTSAEQYFQLVPGTQFVDDFSDPAPLFTERKPWRLIWDSTGVQLLVRNGAFEVSCAGTPRGVFAVLPPGPDVVAGDFSSSVDLLDWEVTDIPTAFFGIVSRSNLDIGYGGGLLLRVAGTSRTVTPALSYGPVVIWGETFDFEEIPPPYRLEYTGLGPNFRLRLIRLATHALIREVNWTNAQQSRGFMGLGGEAPDGSGSYRVRVDNFVVTATKP